MKRLSVSPFWCVLWAIVGGPVALTAYLIYCHYKKEDKFFP